MAKKEKVVEEVPKPEPEPLNLAEETEGLKALTADIPAAIGAAETSLSAISSELIRMEGYAYLLAEKGDVDKIHEYKVALSKVLTVFGELGFDKVTNAIEQSKT